MWAAWCQFHPRGGIECPRPDALKVRTALKDAPVETLIAIVEWAHQAPHERAEFLRGPGYEAGKTGAYLSLTSLMVAKNLTERSGWAAEWDSAGRPHFGEAPAPAASRSATDEAAIGRIVVALEDLLANDGRADRCANPEYARLVLTGLYAARIGIPSLQHLPMDTRHFGLRDVARQLLSARSAPRAAAPKAGVSNG